MAMLASMAIFRPVSCFSSCSRMIPGQVSEISLVSCLMPMCAKKQYGNQAPLACRHWQQVTLARHRAEADALLVKRSSDVLKNSVTVLRECQLVATAHQASAGHGHRCHSDDW